MQTVVKSTLSILAALCAVAVAIWFIFPARVLSCNDFNSKEKVDKYFTEKHATWLDRDQDGRPCEKIK